MKFNLLSIIYLLGALQALVLMIGINIQKPLQNSRKQVLTLLMLAFGAVMFYYIVIITEYSPLYPYTDSMGTAAWMAICPLYYLFCKTLCEPKWEFSIPTLLLFPITILFSIEGVITTLGVQFWFYTWLDNPQLFLDLWMGYFFATGIYFIIKSIFLLKKTEKRQLLRELLWFSYGFLAVLLIFTAIFIVIRHQYKYGFEYALIGLFEIFIFALLYRVFQLTPANALFATEKYTNSPMANEQLTQLAQQLEQTLATQQPFLDKKLNLSKLATISGISTNDLSQLFNIFYNANFYEVVNQHRLAYAEQLMFNPNYEQYKIAALAELSGFNSKATFYKVFKAKHQMTPAQYKKQRST